MNSIERVKAAIFFKNPDRAPIFNGVKGDVLPLLMIPSKKWRPGWDKNEEGLFPHAGVEFKWDKPTWAKENPKYEGNKWRHLPREDIDEWGCIWNMSGRGDNMGHPGRAVLTDWNNYEEYISKYYPDPDDESRYLFAHTLKKSFDNDKYRMFINTFGLSELASKIRGFTNYLMDHRKHPQELKKLLDHLTEYHLKVMKMSFKYGLEPHGFWLSDDLGEQLGPFFSPKIFNKFYEPFYRTIFDEAHNLGCEYHIHCCGKIDRLIPSLIKWGLDAIELDSPRMSGYSDLKPYRGKIMMWGCVNIQSIYSQGTPEECEREVWHMVRNLGTKEGGFGAYFYPQPDVIKVSRKNMRAFERGLKKYSVYSKIPAHWWDYPIVDEWKDDIVPPLPPMAPIV